MITILATVLVTVAAAAAQSRVEPLRVLALPPGDSAWAVRIETTGGFTGRGAGNVTASSDGEMFCTRVTNCPPRLQPEPRRSLLRLVSAIPVALPSQSPSSSSPVTTCSDCVTTTMTVQRRDADGDHTLRYTWDVISAHAVPGEALRLHAAIVALTRPQPR